MKVTGQVIRKDKIMLLVNDVSIADHAEMPKSEEHYFKDCKILIIDRENNTAEMFGFIENKIYFRSLIIKDSKIYNKFPKNELVEVKSFEYIKK